MHLFWRTAVDRGICQKGEHNERHTLKTPPTTATTTTIIKNAVEYRALAGAMLVRLASYPSTGNRCPLFLHSRCRCCCCCCHWIDESAAFRFSICSFRWMDLQLRLCFLFILFGSFIQNPILYTCACECARCQAIRLTFGVSQKTLHRIHIARHRFPLTFAKSNRAFRHWKRACCVYECEKKKSNTREIFHCSRRFSMRGDMRMFKFHGWTDAFTFHGQKGDSLSTGRTQPKNLN